MSSYFIFTFFIFISQRINPFVIISFKINKIDDCIRKIELVDNAILYEKTSEYCHTDGIDTYYDIPLPEIPYELGQKIKIVIGEMMVTLVEFAD